MAGETDLPGGDLSNYCDKDDTLGVPTISKHFRIHEWGTISLEGLLTKDHRLLYPHQGDLFRVRNQAGVSHGREGPLYIYYILAVLFQIVHCP